MDNFEKVAEELQDLVDNFDNKFRWIQMGDQRIKLFNSISNERLPMETFGEYKVRMKINKKLIKQYKNGKRD